MAHPSGILPGSVHPAMHMLHKIIIQRALKAAVSMARWRTLESGADRTQGERARVWVLRPSQRIRQMTPMEIARSIRWL